VYKCLIYNTLEIMATKKRSLGPVKNFVVSWTDGSENNLRLDASTYATSADAGVHSWVLLDRPRAKGKGKAKEAATEALGSEEALSGVSSEQLMAVLKARGAL